VVYCDYGVSEVFCRYCRRVTDGVEKVTLNAIDTNMAKDWLIEYGFSVVGSSNNGHVDFEMAFQ
jgi:hypothetical protein